jgi:hypothetical protein
MISRNLSRRLERLEGQRPSTDVVKVWQIVTIDSAGNLEHGPGYQFQPLPLVVFVPAWVVARVVADNVKHLAAASPKPSTGQIQINLRVARYPSRAALDGPRLTPKS